MNVPISIMAGSALVAAAILVANHWAITPMGAGPFIFKLNRWTGHVTVCLPDPATMKNPNSYVGATYVCETR